MLLRTQSKGQAGGRGRPFEGQKDCLGEYLKAFRFVDCQVGAVFAGNTKVTPRRKGRQEQLKFKKLFFEGSLCLFAQISLCVLCGFA